MADPTNAGKPRVVAWLGGAESICFIATSDLYLRRRVFNPPPTVKMATHYFQDKNGQAMLWSRGNGWVLAGLARILEDLPKDDPERGKFEGIFKALAAQVPTEKGWRALEECQRPDGMVGYVQRIGYAPGELTADANQEYGTDAFLLAGCELPRFSSSVPAFSN